VNPISAISWFWKALRGNSVTFAVLLACALLGMSVLRWLKDGLYAVGTPWWLVLVIPSVLIGLLAKKERVWIPDEARRRLWARSVVVGAVLLSVLIALLKPAPKATPAKANLENSAGSPAGESAATPSPSMRPRGPSGK
jgi:hypothetical protein